MKIQRIMIKDRYLIGPTTRFLLTAERRAHEKKYLVMIISALTRHRYAIFIENGYNYTDS